jgi:predicted metal-dependent HD superfamily phosphohydrolase
MSWSKIQHTELARQAVGIIVCNTFDNYTDVQAEIVLHYHNMQHIHSMYAHLEDGNHPYDESLDWAVLFHDIVYDAKPNKELRSALLFMQLAASVPGCTLDEEGRLCVFKMIMNTERHENTSCALVQADLHQLTNSVQTFKNFVAIMQESMALYSIDELNFAISSELYMQALLQRIQHNMPPNSRFWQQVEVGIQHTIQLAKIVQGK